MSKRVLILDDDDAVGQTIQFTVEAAGVEARAVSDPDAFLELVDEWEPTHIVLDLVMPRMDGIEVMRLLAERKTTARLVILSGVGTRVLDAAHRVAAEKGLRIAGVLPKPIRPARLREVLQKNNDETGSSGKPRARGALPPVTAKDLRRALDEKLFFPAFQPKIRCDNGEVAGFEVLLRWHHDDGEFIPPDAFIPLAESENMIGELTDLVLGHALGWLSEPGPTEAMGLSVNLSARTLSDIHFADRLAKRCQDAGVAPDRLTLELTETAATGDPMLALDLVTRLRMKGFPVSIDDVGTGYSSMAQLAALPFSEMKVDKSFVMSAARSQESRTIVTSIIELGHNLDLDVVAEGVEDEATLEFLRKHGCDYAQGFLIARPMNRRSAGEWIARRH